MGLPAQHLASDVDLRSNTSRVHPPRRTTSRRSRIHANPSRANHWVVRIAAAMVLLTVACIIVVDDSFGVQSFAAWYATRFVTYYAPKIKWANEMLGQIMEYLPEELSAEATDAWDYAIAITVMASVYHIIERLRVKALSKLQE